jgi:hypothetical protein
MEPATANCGNSTRAQSTASAPIRVRADQGRCGKKLAAQFPSLWGSSFSVIVVLISSFYINTKMDAVTDI